MYEVKTFDNDDELLKAVDDEVNSDAENIFIVSDRKEYAEKKFGVLSDVETMNLFQATLGMRADLIIVVLYVRRSSEARVKDYLNDLQLRLSREGRMVVYQLG